MKSHVIMRTTVRGANKTGFSKLLKPGTILKVIEHNEVTDIITGRWCDLVVKIEASKVDIY
jgi:hypothetical protein